MFSLQKTSLVGRRGRVTLRRGIIETPFFMPVGTAGAMKGLTHRDILELGAEILLCNTYHLFLQPGDEIIRDTGGLHTFIGWDKPILTDSGGFQVFSLKTTNRIDDNGVHFRSPVNGDPFFLGPEESIFIQHNLGSDIVMAFDECPPSTAKRSEIAAAVDRTLRWAGECKKVHDELKKHGRYGKHGKKGEKESCVSPVSPVSHVSHQQDPLLFGIVQGGLERDLRKKCAEELIAMGFDGYAIGGLAVGESPEEMYGVLDDVVPLLPEEKLRYLMGVGAIDQLKASVAKGIDMFDCVLPMRMARHGTILLSDGASLRIVNAEFRHDHSVIDPDSPSDLSRLHKKNYLHHLFKANERLAETIACKQNLGVTLQTMRDLQTSITY